MNARLSRVGQSTRLRAAALTASAVVSSLVLTASGPSALAAPSSSAGRAQAMSGADLRLHRLLEDVTVAGVPGVIARVQDRREILVGSAGVADRDTLAALRPEARFRVGSVTKTFVATVVLQLVGEGRLTLDQPVQHWLPGLLRDGPTITVRELLNHTSGLFDYTADPTLFEDIAQNRVFQPAELDQRIFEPLGLRDTSFPTATARITGYHAHGYVPAPDGTLYDVTGINPSHAWAAGAIISSAADVSRFYQSLMEGRLLSPRLLREMKTTVPEDPAEPTVRYGLGLERIQDPCGVLWGHNGAIFGYQDMAYWNQRTHSTTVIVTTIYPGPPTAGPALDRLAGFALCASQGSGS